MRFNIKALASLSQGPPANFDKEGKLWVHRIPPGIPQKPERRERWCRLTGNLLFLMQSPSQRSDPVEVIVLERCHVVESGDNHSALRIKFESGETDLCLEAGTASALQSWITVLREANSESLREKILHLQRLLMAMTASVEADSPKAGGARADAILVPELPLVEFSLACQALASPARDRKPNSMLQISVVNTLERSLAAYSCTEIVEGTRDPLFLTGVTFPPDYPLCEETVLKLTVYDVRDRSAESRSFLGFASFSVGDLLKEHQLTLSLRTSDGTSAVGAVVVSRLSMGEAQNGETEQVTAADATGQKHTVVCDPPEGSLRGGDSGPLTSAVFRNPVCKVYRFQTTDSKWMLVREKMAECTLSFHIPKQLLKLYIQEDMTRIQELQGLGELSPHWDNLRKELMGHLGQAIRSYQEVLTELSKMGGTSFKPSCCKAEKYLEFIPINLHTQRMQVTSPKQTETAYDIITVGAPAAHSLGFKNGGLRRQLGRFEAEKKSFSTTYQCIYFSPEDTAKARGVLASISQLQPLISSLADQLMQAARQRSAESLKETLKTLCDTTERFVHAMKEELVKSAHLALHAARPDYVSDSVGTNGSPPREDGPAPLKRQNSVPPRVDYDEEEWDRVWTNVAKSLNCIIAMVDRLQELDSNEQEVSPEPTLADVITSHTPDVDGWQEKIYPLVVTLKDCVMEVVDRAKKSMTFVLLQEAACSLPQGLLLRQRRDTVFSQALTALSCGFIMRLNAGMQDEGFLQQLHLVGVLAQFESLLSTYSEEIGMLEDMEVGIADLHSVTFKITEAKSSDAVDLQPKVCGWRECYTVEVPLPCRVFRLLPAEVKGQPLHVYPVLFNVGINQQQTLAERFGDVSLQERINQKNFYHLENYYKSLSDKVPLKCLPPFQTQTNLKELLGSLSQHVAARKKKNVEILWLAGAICRRLNGIRFTSCKSAKDRTSMSVTLEQCSLLRDEHQLDSENFSRALDCMRREGCRIENVQKNIKCRKYAFNGLQLMAFPKCYRPPDGTYGKAET
ncbi:type II inositol 3,4-bisphosphate 4-phosphatase-like isoform X2 [Brienomyrus brachyistius]|uniref:type II inositol 3,4-bisphosphate 4-phosphatase-like isoform X2 n=1 Tax=Brienomyrus brachyistius TaxID=42636 RepID=UPI0020B35B69|nr:type II inositol 3,4-bisphosphate 4-phosphatase-like isoform X2 [Brienomyrus brachyistius]